MKIIPRNRLSSNFNPGTHQLLSISRLRFFYFFFSIVPTSMAPKPLHCPFQPHPTADMQGAHLLHTTLLPRCIYSVNDLTAQNSKKKKKKGLKKETGLENADPGAR